MVDLNKPTDSFMMRCTTVIGKFKSSGLSAIANLLFIIKIKCLEKIQNKNAHLN